MRNYGLNKVFVEGKSDRDFLHAVLLRFFNIDCSQKEHEKLVISTEGKDNLKNQPDLASSQERIREGARNLVIFDADLESKGGGLEMRRNEYGVLAELLGADFRLFLFPDNERDGELENIVGSCFREEFRFFDECWSRMIECFGAKGGVELNLPGSKGFIFSYADLFDDHRTKPLVKGKTNFLDEGLWMLDTENNEGLKRLVSFIDQNLFEE